MWQRINDFVKTKTVIATFLLTVGFLLAVSLVGLPTMQGSMDQKIGMPILTIHQIILAVVGIFLMKKLQVFNKEDFKFKNIGKGFLLGWLILVLIAIMILTGFSSRSSYFVKPDIVFLLAVIVFPFGTGLLEEVVFRGLILKLLLKKTGDTRKGITNAFIISAVLFALAHLIHLLWVSPLEMVGDLLFPLAGGMFLGAIYLRTKTLIPCILLHSLLNLSGMIFTAFTSPEYIVPETTINDLLVIVVVAVIPLVIATFILLRKVRPEEIELSN